MDSNITLLLSRGNIYKYNNTLLKYTTPVGAEPHPDIHSAHFILECYNDTLPCIIAVTDNDNFISYIYLTGASSWIPVYTDVSNRFSIDASIRDPDGSWYIRFTAMPQLIKNIASIKCYNYFKYVPEGETLLTINSTLATNIKGPGWRKSGNNYYPEQNLCSPIYVSAINNGQYYIPGDSCIPVFGLGTWSSFDTDDIIRRAALATNNSPLVNNSNVLGTPWIWTENGILHWDPAHLVPIYMRGTNKTIYNQNHWEINDSPASDTITSGLLNGYFDMDGEYGLNCLFIYTCGEPWVVIDDGY